MNFRVYTKEKFEYELSILRKEYDLTYWKDITDIISEESECNVCEYVYAFDTNIHGMKLIIYSTVDITTNKTRDNGTDAVRVVLRWETKNGILYRHIKTHKRIDTLFNNLENTILDNLILEKEDLRGNWAKDIM